MDWVQYNIEYIQHHYKKIHVLKNIFDNYKSQMLQFTRNTERGKLSTGMPLDSEREYLYTSKGFIFTNSFELKEIVIEQ